MFEVHDTLPSWLKIDNARLPGVQSHHTIRSERNFGKIVL